MAKKEGYQLELEGARFYEENFVPSLFENWAKRTVEELSLSDGDQLLDIACGTGIVARIAQASKINELRITGIDINEAMLEVAKEIEPEIDWIKGSAQNLPFDDQSFEKISCQFGFMFFEDQVKSLNEMKRIRKSEGKTIIGIWDTIEANEGYFDLLQIIENIGGEDLGQILRSPFKLGDKDEINKIVKSSEISNYKIETIRTKVEFRSIDHWIDCDVKASPIAEEISDQQYSELLKKAKLRLNKYLTEDQKVRFNMSAHIVTIE
jgi:ubiquinone/menaquinone biosynthesis C-methylase UbiE